MEVTTTGLVLGVSGFESQVPALVSAILTRLRQVLKATMPATNAEGAEGGELKGAGEVDKLRGLFETQRELLLVDLQNTELESPYGQAAYWIRQVGGT